LFLRVGLRVAPAIEQVAALARAATRAARGLGGGRAVIDHPDFVEAIYAQDDLIEPAL
jgi:hypothetical protein